MGCLRNLSILAWVVLIFLAAKCGNGSSAQQASGVEWNWPAVKALLLALLALAFLAWFKYFGNAAIEQLFDSIGQVIKRLRGRRD